MRMQPLVAFRDCEHCKKWLYDEKTGLVLQRHGNNVPRGEIPTPCDSKVGCAKGHYDNQKSLSNRNQMAYQHYRECKAIGRFPDDAVVVRNAGVIAEIEDYADKLEIQGCLTGSLGALFGSKK